MDGMSGTRATRLGLVTPMAFTLPERTSGSTCGMLPRYRSICPPMMSLSTGAPPLYGTCSSCIPPAMAINSVPMWGRLPLPEVP